MRTLIGSILVFLAIQGCAPAARAQKAPEPAQAPQPAAKAKQAAQPGARVLGPFVSDNLALYLIRGDDRLKESWLPLHRAIRGGQVVVHETGDVNELAIENRSNLTVFIQSGEIVKGGKQDRVLARDLILPPRSGRVPLAAFCIEQGRWSRRGVAPDDRFDSSEQRIAGKALKLAVSRAKRAAQRAAWRDIRQTQALLRRELQLKVTSSESPSSLQLTLEHPEVQRAAGRMIEPLLPLARKHADVVGLAFAINGEASGAEVYASRQMFLAQWPRLLQAAAVDALMQGGDKRAAPPAPDRIARLLAEARTGAARQRFIETTHPQKRGEWVHRSYIFEVPEVTRRPGAVR